MGRFSVNLTAPPAFVFARQRDVQICQYLHENNVAIARSGCCPPLRIPILSGRMDPALTCTVMLFGALAFNNTAIDAAGGRYRAHQITQWCGVHCQELRGPLIVGKTLANLEYREIFCMCSGVPLKIGPERYTWYSEQLFYTVGHDDGYHAIESNPKKFLSTPV